MSETFASVVEAWQQADPTHIHPLRNVNEDDYWASGVSQAEDAAQWIPDHGTVIDFGCGDGRLSLPLSLFGFKVIAVDSAQAMLDRVLANQTERGGRINQTILSDGTNLPDLIDSPVDAVVCRAVLIHHDYPSVIRLVNAFAAVLKPGGHLIADWPVGPKYIRQSWTDVTTWEPNHRAKVAADAGFRLVSIEPDQPSVWVKL